MPWWSLLALADLFVINRPHTRVLWDATSLGLCGRVGPPRTNVRAAKSKEDGEEERGARGIVRESCPKPKPNPREPNPKPTPQIA